MAQDIKVGSNGRAVAPELHEALLDSMTEGVSLSSEAGVIIYTNPAEDRMFGYEPGELVGQHVSVQNAYEPQDNERRVGEVIEHLKQHGRWEGEWRNRRKDGSEFVTASRITAVQVAGASHWLCVQRDVTEQKVADERLRSSEARFRLMANSAPVAIWVNGADGGCEFVNQEYLRFFGKTLEEVVGFGWLPAAHPEDGDAYISAYLAAVETRSRFEATARFQAADGTYRWLHSVAEPRITDAGAYLGHVGVSSDITDQKKADLRQRMLVEELNHRVKNTLAIVQSIAHQSLRTPDGPSELVKAFEGRLMALASAHRILTERSWEDASVREIISSAVAPYDNGAIQLDGPDLTVHPQTAVNLSLAMNELATNAAKYGALSDGTGRVEIGWAADEGNFELVWRERGGPTVEPPQRRGFGTRMIERVLAAELRGTIKIDFRPEGVVCAIEAPSPSGEAA